MPTYLAATIFSVLISNSAFAQGSLQHAKAIHAAVNKTLAQAIDGGIEPGDYEVRNNVDCEGGGLLVLAGSVRQIFDDTSLIKMVAHWEKCQLGDVLLSGELTYVVNDR